MFEPHIRVGKPLAARMNMRYKREVRFSYSRNYSTVIFDPSQPLFQLTTATVKAVLIYRLTLSNRTNLLFVPNAMPKMHGDSLILSHPTHQSQSLIKPQDRHPAMHLVTLLPHPPLLPRSASNLTIFSARSHEVPPHAARSKLHQGPISPSSSSLTSISSITVLISCDACRV